MRCSVFYRSLLVLGSSLLVAGCTSLQYVLPQSFNLSGDWTLDEEASDASFDVSEIWDSEKRAIFAGDAPDPTDSATFIVHDFPVVVSNSVHIEQDDESMGIRYDDAPYEDYKWGRNIRDGWRLDVGWDGRSLVVSKRRDSVKGTEIFSLNDSGDVLRVRVRVQSKDKNYTFDRVYARQ